MKVLRSAFAALAIVHLSLGANPIKADDHLLDIVDTAVGAGTFNTLAAALSAADLVDVLKGDGPFTVFAPTDEAFSKLPEGTVESLLLPENKGQLISILLYHVVSGTVLSPEVVSLETAATLNGASVSITHNDAGPNSWTKIDAANITAVDILATNGVIHVLDAVILPPAGPTAVEAISWGTVKDSSAK